jgi:3-oxoacyl-[acyl-carrier protein] reductase
MAAATAGGRRALVLGGTGFVGGQVVRALQLAGVPTSFTWFRNEARAAELVAALEGDQVVAKATACPIDLRDAVAVRSLVVAQAPSVLVHAAVVSSSGSLDDLATNAWDEAHAVNVRSAFVAVQAAVAAMTDAGGGDVVLVGALDRAQSLPLPVHFAATQGALAAMTMALAKELGPRKIRVNMVALGVLDGGIATTLSGKRLVDYKTFSALRRTGTAAEAARAIVWVALENTWMTGKIVPVNGGI